jgi:hypothetical protein
MNNETRDSGVSKNALIKSSMYEGTLAVNVSCNCINSLGELCHRLLFLQGRQGKKSFTIKKSRNCRSRTLWPFMSWRVIEFHNNELIAHSLAWRQLANIFLSLIGLLACCLAFYFFFLFGSNIDMSYNEVHNSSYSTRLERHETLRDNDKSQ